LNQDSNDLAHSRKSTTHAARLHKILYRRLVWLTLSDWAFFLEFQQNSRIATRIASARPQSSTTKTPPEMTKPKAHYFNVGGAVRPSLISAANAQDAVGSREVRWGVFVPYLELSSDFSPPLPLLPFFCGASLSRSKEKRKEVRQKKKGSQRRPRKIVRAISERSVHSQIDRVTLFGLLHGKTSRWSIRG